jgi:phosphopantetheinyl transferase
VSIVVAHAALAAWDLDALVPCLAPSERARFASLPHARRRHEFAIGRVLAKHVYLSSRAPRATSTTAHIAAFSQSSYRDVEIIRADGPPRLVRRGEIQTDTHVSIAHGAGHAAAALSTGGPIGVDIVDVTRREPSFYRQQFSRREQAWANGEESYALLWALKESVMKAGAVPDATLWGFDEIEIFVEESAAVLDQQRSDNIIPLTVRVPRAAGAIADAGFARVGNMLLSFITLEPSATHAVTSGGVNAWQHR